MIATLHEECPACEGQRWVGSPDPRTCGNCRGTGRVDSPKALARIKALEAEVARLRAEARVAWQFGGGPVGLDATAAGVGEVADA
jgi:hypothetical protein